MIETQPIYLTKKAGLSITILMVISMGLLLQSVSAQEILLESPSDAPLNENFSVKISYESDEVLDIKISVQDRDSKIYSETYGIAGWRSSFYYLPNSFSSQSEYTLRITKPGENLNVCVKLREGKKVFKESMCNNISLIILESIPEGKSSPLEQESEPAEADKGESLALKAPELPPSSKALSSGHGAVKEDMKISDNNEILLLNSRRIESQKGHVQQALSIQGKINLLAFVLFPLFLFFILFFLLNKKEARFKR